MDFVQEEERDLKNIFKRFRTGNFRGNAGEMIKNSSYQFADNLILKIGSLLFTIIVARMLLPDLMGLYSLALSTIVFFSAFSDLGLGTALFTYVARISGKGDGPKAKGYFLKLLKWKVWLSLGVSIILLASANFVSKVYYGKPILYALLVGALYIPLLGIISFVETIFKATGNFKHPLIKDIVFQVLRLTLVPLGIFLLLKGEFSQRIVVMFILIILVLCYFIALFVLWTLARKKVSFLGESSKKLNGREIKSLKKFIFPLTVTALSGVFFGYIDTIMLGHFVKEAFIAYYGAAFSLVSSAAAIISFASIAVFPLFSKLEGKSLEKIFRKTRNFVWIICLGAGAFTYFFAYYVVKVAYGGPYLEAVPLLKWFAILVMFLPITSIYDNYLISQRKTKIVGMVVVVSTLINIVLNIVGISYGLKIGGQIGGVYGAVFATIISRLIYFGGVFGFRRRVVK